MRFLAFLFTVFFVLSIRAEKIDVTKLRAFGPDNRPIIYVFISPNCPHCAAYHQDILPVLQAHFAQKGLAQIRIVDSVHEVRSLKIALLARCMTNKQYSSFMDDVYTHQGDWGFEKKYEDTLRRYATWAGLDTNNQNQCLFNQELIKTITEQSQNLSKNFGVRAYPTTVVLTKNGPKIWKGADKRIIPEIKALFIK